MANETDRKDGHAKTSSTRPTRMSRRDQATVCAEVRRLAREGPPTRSNRAGDAQLNKTGGCARLPARGRRQGRSGDRTDPGGPTSSRSLGRRSIDPSGSFGPILLVGLWLLVARHVLGYVSADPRWNDVTCGAILVACALVCKWLALRSGRLHLVSALVGAWLVTASLATDISSSARLNDGIAGVAVFMVALSGLSTSEAAKPPPSVETHR